MLTNWTGVCMGSEPLRDRGLALDGPEFELVADGSRFTPAEMAPEGDATWRRDDVTIRLEVAEGRDGSVDVVLEADGIRHVEEVCLLSGRITPTPDDVVNHTWFDRWGLQRSTALFVRHGDRGAFAAYAHPFGRAEVDDDRVRLWYPPGLVVDGRFRSDPLVVGRYDHAGRPVRREAVRGRDGCGEQVADLVRLAGSLPCELDRGAVQAVRAAVEARVPWEPARMRVAAWDWGPNLFRLDPDDPATRQAYERWLQLCAELGVEEVLVAPGGRWTEEASHRRMKGPWQPIMWLGMGDDTFAGTWTPDQQLPLVSAVRERAAVLGLGVVAYSNPQVRWRDEAAWELDDGGDPSDRAYRMCCLAVPAAQDWIRDLYRRFRSAHDLAGFSLDFVFWPACFRDADEHGHLPGASSQYAQWDGYRRIVGDLRRADPQAWIEGLIGSQPLLPWGSRDLTHPHPFNGDNQPQWVLAWPDLSLDRVNANQQRRVGFWFRTFAFTPSYKVPGQVGHQANRMRFADVERGWDWEGARYNLLSAIASGPSSLSVCYLPCWDEAEWQAMRDRDGTFFADWIAFAKQHQDVLARLEDLFDEPCPGTVDGTVARHDDGTGFVFLANPDFVPHDVDLTGALDDGIVLRELHPEPGRHWLPGRVTVEPHEVQVLELVPAVDVPRPAVIGVVGRADTDGRIGAATGTPGTTVDAQVWTTNGTHDVTVAFADDGIRPTLGPWRDADGTEVDLAHLDGAVTLTTEWAPGTTLPQLLAQLAPPVPPEGDEHRNPWADPSRLRLFPALLDPATATVRIRVDGTEAGITPAWVGTYDDVTSPPTGGSHLLGWYADLTDRLAATDDLARPWRIELDVDLAFPGQLTCVHVTHLPRRTTTRHELVDDWSTP